MNRNCLDRDQDYANTTERGTDLARSTGLGFGFQSQTGARVSVFSVADRFTCKEFFIHRFEFGFGFYLRRVTEAGVNFDHFQVC